VPGRGPDKQDCLAARVQQQFPDVQVVHRLDMATSGLMIFARGNDAQRKLSLMFQAREVEKSYVAIVSGKLEGESEIRLPIAADWPNRPLRKVDLLSGKPSLTRYRGLSYDPVAQVSRLELQPITGRTHQLRVHLAAIGHAIVGDALYGNEKTGNARLLLHAQSLRFLHPQQRVPLHFFSAAPF